MQEFLNANTEWVSEYVIPWGINIVTAVAIYIVGRFIAKLIVKSLLKVLERANVDLSLRGFIGNIANVVLLVVIVIAALEQLGIDTTSVLAVFAAAGLAVGLALKDSLSNFAAGVMLIIFKPFKVGDVINTAGSIGKVQSIQIFNTVLRTGDNQEIVIPNSQVFGGSITNITACETRRIDLVVGIGYDDDIKKAKSLVETIIAGNPTILKDPEPTIMVLELGESSVDLAIRPWVNTADYWTVRSDLLQTIKETFDENGISIPYPQRDFHIIQQDATALAT
jgi:small conductance mechanosensitive channel